MRRILFAFAAGVVLLSVVPSSAPTACAPDPAVAAALADPATSVDCAEDAAAMAALQEQFQAGGVVAESWPPHAIGGVVPPVRSVSDPFPTFDGIALDPENDRVVVSDENRHSLLVYDRATGSLDTDVTEPAQWIFGPKTQLGFIAGVEVDPARKEIYTVNNDSGDRLTVFGYADHGNVAPKRSLVTPHQSWDVSLAATRDEIAITVQQSNAISIFRRTATGREGAVRTIRGVATELQDPHGIFYDDTHGELVTANHGNWTQIRPYTPYDPLVTDVGGYKPGAFHPSSITVHAADATENTPPIRKIQGDATGLNWPMGIDVDLKHDEIAVANYGDSSVRVFARTAAGDQRPLRVIRGAATGIVGPISVAIDARHDELWVANYGDHTALVFGRTDTGDVKPKRIVRNAPAGTPTTGFTNASAVAYDKKRSQLLVPN